MHRRYVEYGYVYDLRLLLLLIPLLPLERVGGTISEKKIVPRIVDVYRRLLKIINLD